MGRQHGKSKVDSHKTERLLRRITMLMRLQRIKARMATQSSEQQRPSPVSQQQQQSSDHHTHRASNRDRQRSTTRSSSSQQRSSSDVPVPSLASILQRSGQAAFMLHPDRQQQRSEASSKRSLRFSHRHRQSEQLRRQLERQASSQRPSRVRVVAVIMVPAHSGGGSGAGGGQSSGLSRSSRRRMRRSLARELRMSAGRPHVLNLVRRLLGRVESMAAGPEESADANGGEDRMIVSQGQNERTPEKGNQSGEGDDQKTG